MQRADMDKPARASKRSATPAAEDIALFRAAVAGATPLARVARAARPRPPSPPIPVQSLLDEHEALAEARRLDGLDDALIDGLNEASFSRPGLGRDVLRKLRRGQWAVQAELDLHGATRASAKLMLEAFMRRCETDGARCVRVVHGKGLGSPRREPVLRGLTRRWLARHPRVLAYCEAPPAKGGAGAVLVLLR